MKIIVGVVIVSLVGIGWLGVTIRPAPFELLTTRGPEPKMAPLPSSLPAPVERFYRTLYGDKVPVIETAVITGRGQLRINGITLPARYRFIHETGQGYRHYIEPTFFGLPILSVNERYVEGQGRMDLPFGVSEGEKIDQGANLALWAEAVWMPSVWLTDSQVRWEAVDSHTALLFVPPDEHFVVRFDPETGLPHLMESMRFKDDDASEKVLWINEVVKWDTVNGATIPAVASVTWLDDGTPWAVFHTEHIAYNVDVDLHATGP